VLVAMLVALPGPAQGAPGAGTLADPVVVDAFPYVAAGTTAGAPSAAIDSYSCAPALDESGPERIYEFTLPYAARVTAWIEGDDGQVDIDVQLLTDLTLSGTEATSCAARANQIAEAEMDAGVHYAVVDSYQGAAQAGPFVLHLEAIGDAWIERTLAQGVGWRARRFSDFAGPQVVHELVVDTTEPGVEIRALRASGCQTVGALGNAAGAIAGINGGYFAAGCAPVSLLKASGNLLGTNAVSRGAFGLQADGTPLVAVVPAGEDWPAAFEAHGGGPVLAVAGAAHQGANAWAAEGFSAAGFLGANPRTLAGFEASGRVHLATVDGRRANAAGMSLDDLAAFAADSELGLGLGLGLNDASNLDGGGSTTMWISGATPNGVVNYPSDATQEDPAHPGSRPCSGGFFVFAPPYNHPPRFQTAPVTDAQAGTSYAYDADAIDLDPADLVTYSLALGPDGMAIDSTTGMVSYAPTVASPPSAQVSIRASDNRGAATDQTFELLIEGGQGTAGAGGAGAAGGASPAGGAAGSATSTPGLVEGDNEAGCGCRTARPAGHGWAWACVFGLGLLARRRRLNR
jgi:hypothetical protein